jgi:hypothetical protein
MKITIEIDVDNFTGNNYEHLNPESKQRITNGVRDMLKDTVSTERKAKLQKLLEELQNESEYNALDPEVLYELFRDAED